MAVSIGAIAGIGYRAANDSAGSQATDNGYSVGSAMPVMVTVIPAVMTAVITVTTMVAIITTAIMVAILHLLDVTDSRQVHCRQRHRGCGAE